KHAETQEFAGNRMVFADGYKLPLKLRIQRPLRDFTVHDFKQAVDIANENVLEVGKMRNGEDDAGLSAVIRDFARPARLLMREDDDLTFAIVDADKARPLRLARSDVQGIEKAEGIRQLVDLFREFNIRVRH